MIKVALSKQELVIKLLSFRFTAPGNKFVIASCYMHPGQITVRPVGTLGRWADAPGVGAAWACFRLTNEIKIFLQANHNNCFEYLTRLWRKILPNEKFKLIFLQLASFQFIHNPFTEKNSLLGLFLNYFDNWK